LTETDLGGGRVHYELSQEERHHHLVCRQCGKTFALDDLLIEPLRSALMDAHGFAADMEHFAIFGLCASCQAQALTEH
jgi:Fur family ferric uptake transcriptional regulator